LEIIARYYPDAKVYTNVPINYAYSDLIWETDPIPEADLLNLRLQMIKDIMKDILNTRRERFLKTGFWYQGYLYDCDDISRTNVTGACAGILLGEDLPSGFTWRDKNNNNHPFDTARMKHFALQMLKWITTVYQTSWYVKEQIQAMTDAEAIKSFPLDAYWPDNNFDNSKPAPGDPAPPL
jgi:hypothetical protein